MTYKAMNDSAVFNPDLYKIWARRLLGLPEGRQVTRKEVVINDIDRPVVMAGLDRLRLWSC